MNIKPIRNEADYEDALKQAEFYFDNQPEFGTEEADFFDVLVTLIEAYEQKHFPVGLPDPIEAIKFRMEQQALKPKDLVPMIGGVNRVYEVLNGKRQLSLSMIRKLHQNLDIPLLALIK